MSPIKALLVLFFFLPANLLADNLQALRQWIPATVVDDEDVRAVGLDHCFASLPIPDAVWQRMQGKSYGSGCTIPRTSLRYLHLLHRNTEGRTQIGEMVCHQSVANDLVAIFRRLYELRYPIARITLVDDYDADDQRSMEANNTSCFNFRRVAGTNSLSKHARGLAVDVNPLVNPCVSLKSGQVQPTSGKPYATQRNTQHDMPLPLITTSDSCYALFIRHGFNWGGNWRYTKDYQHFER